MIIIVGIIIVILIIVCAHIAQICNQYVCALQWKSEMYNMDR